MSDSTPKYSSSSANTTNTIIDTASYHTSERYEKLCEFVTSAFANYSVRIESLPGDASFRRYHRVYLGESIDAAKAPQQYDATYIVMDAPPNIESIESFVRIDLLMEMRVNVPTLYAKDINQGFLLMQDFGSTEFAHLVAKAKIEQDSAQIDKLYHWAMDSIVKLQTIKPDLAKHSFHVQNYDDTLLNNEMDLFSEWFLPYIGIPLEESTSNIWQDFKQTMILQLLSQPQVVVHRDYHSRNLMEDQYQPESLGVIDFQDTVIGPYTYDLVSLLRDAYVDWSEAKIHHWIKYFWQQITQKDLNDCNSLESFTTEVNLTGIQRHLKILGIFVRLANRDGKTKYLQEIPKVWRDLMDEFDWLSQHADKGTIQRIEPMYHWLQQNIEPKFKQVFKV